ncbi:MAG TPA: ABC transporter permease [Pyrinomonadaceae bacterium]|nr:ABC transporter permease [Pyrinomonadaceae bacterium]
MNTFLQDLRYGVHMLTRNPGFTAVAVLTLALGIGANTALFSVVDALLLKKLPVEQPDQLVLFNSLSNREFSAGAHNGSIQRDPVSGATIRSSFPYVTFKKLREARGALSDVIAFGRLSVNVNANNEVDVARGQAVSGNYFATLGVPAFAGRTIQESDDEASATPVAVISHRYWTRRFGSDPGIVGKQINLNNVPFTVAGIAQEGFEGTMQVGSAQDVYIPISWEEKVNGEQSNMKGSVWWLRLMGRLKPGATAAQARDSLDAAFQQSVLEFRADQEQLRKAAGSGPLSPLEPKNYPHLGALPGSQGEMGLRSTYVRPLRLLLGVVGLVLIIAAANVANLLLVKASSRRREIAVRLALGATRSRLIRQLMTENLVLALLGGGCGVVFAFWIKDSVLAVTDWGQEMPALNPRLDLRVLGFTLAVSLLTGLVFGLAPALRATRLTLTPALKDAAGSSSASARSWLTRTLVVAQVSISVLLLVGAGLLVRTLINLQHVEPGFNQNNVLLFTVQPGLIGYKDERLADLYRRLSERIEAVPGVTAATFSQIPLLSFSSNTGSVFLPGAQAGLDGRIAPAGDVYVHDARENFLEAMQVPLLTGRALNAHDDAHAPKVAVVNQTFAKQYFPNENPIGKRFGFGPKTSNKYEIVGIARDAKYTSQRDDIPPTTYLSWLQDLEAMGEVTFAVRTNGDPGAAVGAIRQAVKEVENNLPLKDVKTQIEQADETLAMERLFAKLVSLFGLLAQQLASIGLYGVLAWSVSQRIREIGIRMALGADRRSVLRMVLRQGLTLTLIGVALGLGGAFVLTKYLESLTTMLYGVQPRDPLTFGVAGALLTAVALVACYIPARRATKVDPLVALHYE